MPQISALMHCWTSGVATDYSEGRIYYEEDLHASLYYHLRSKGLEVHVDALKSQSAISRLSPDIIICSGRHIDVLVEIKYAPWINLKSYHLEERCLKDVQKLAQIDAAKSSHNSSLAFSLRIDAATGQACEPDFILDSSTQYALGVIAQAAPQERHQFQEHVARGAVSIAGRFYLMTGWVGEAGGFDMAAVGSA